MKNFLFVFFVFVATANSYAADPGQRVQSEFQRLHAQVSTLQPEFVVGGYLQGKSYGDHKILWHLAEEPGDAELISIQRKKKDGEQAFDVTFHRNDVIVRGRNVIRRFVGPSQTGWRNDTVDSRTGEYLGTQGAERPRLDQRDREILKQWDIEIAAD